MRLYGEAAGSAVSIQIDFGGAWAFQSVLTGADSLAPRQPGQPVSLDQEIILAEFSFPMELIGWQPISISCSGGEVVWSRAECNYFGTIRDLIGFKPDAVWTHHVPASLEEAVNDINTLTAESLEVKYGYGLPYNNLDSRLILSTENHWWDCNETNTVESDGRRNVMINGESKLLDTELRQQGLIGDWAWHIGANQTLNCEVFIAEPQLD
jgi:hypothetical protein